MEMKKIDSDKLCDIVHDFRARMIQVQFDSGYGLLQKNRSSNMRCFTRADVASGAQI
jgi:hypothetical protein